VNVPAEPDINQQHGVLFGAKSLDELLTESRDMVAEAIDRVKVSGKRVVAIVPLFSGGDDSTVLADIFRDQATHIGHANTGTGIEQTLQFVRDTCARWDVPLLEQRLPEGHTYRDLVLGRVLATSGENKGKPVYSGGFPGPAMHWLMYQRLKERSLERIRNLLVRDGRQERVIFLAGRRKEESARRKARAGSKQIKPVERKGSTVWVSPLLNWSKLDLNSYRKVNRDVPRNEVAALLHMSGECLCGAFAHPQELDEIEDWYPEKARELRGLGREVTALGTVPPQYCTWGHGIGIPSASGPLCSSCPARFFQDELPAAEAS
jgi:3'-phosphoadenosine 5'-phosphosulfate sulfotransferase (PAPS reductase)/FAD synthetase